MWIVIGLSLLLLFIDVFLLLCTRLEEIHCCGFFRILGEDKNMKLSFSPIDNKK